MIGYLLSTLLRRCYHIPPSWDVSLLLNQIISAPLSAPPRRILKTKPPPKPEPTAKCKISPRHVCAAVRSSYYINDVWRIQIPTRTCIRTCMPAPPPMERTCLDRPSTSDKLPTLLERLQTGSKHHHHMSSLGATFSPPRYAAPASEHVIRHHNPHSQSTSSTHTLPIFNARTLHGRNKHQYTSSYNHIIIFPPHPHYNYHTRPGAQLSSPAAVPNPK